jgi:hypothetical protein
MRWERKPRPFRILLMLMILILENGQLDPESGQPPVTDATGGWPLADGR